MKALLSIKPEFAEKIFAGTKRFEFRRAVFKKEGVGEVLVYASSPIQRVIGEFRIGGIISGDVDAVWRKTRSHAGITHEYYQAYFSGRENANAIKVESPRLFARKRKLSEYRVSAPPQSFLYV